VFFFRPSPLLALQTKGERGLLRTPRGNEINVSTTLFSLREQREKRVASLSLSCKARAVFLKTKQPVPSGKVGKRRK